MKELTLQEKMLCNYYLSHFCKLKAMTQAGYGETSKKEGKQLEKYLHNKAAAIFAKDYIKKYIADKLIEIEDKLVVSREELLKYLARCVAGDMYEKKIINYRDSYEIITIQICIKDRTEAAKLLFKFHDLEGKGKAENVDKPNLIDDIKENKIDEKKEIENE